jgi:protein-tyrosine-phosphatase
MLADAVMKIVTLCTGNVARSVMLGYMLTTLSEVSGLGWRVRTAGTHVIEGSAMSSRTKDALLALDDLGDHRYGAHRSHQLNGGDVEWADVVLASEANHVNFVRSNFPDGSQKTVLLAQLLSESTPDVNFDERLRQVALMTPSAFFDVDDPAGGDQATYNACAKRLWSMAQVFASLATHDASY